MLFDSHAHFDDARFDEDRESIIQKVQDSGVSYVVNVGADMEGSVASVELADKYPFIYASVGFHPYDADKVNDETIGILEKLAENKKVVAIGETGLDYTCETVSREVQAEAFRRQCKLADKLGLPVIVHDRDAHKDIMDILKEEQPARAIIHCFSGSPEMAEIFVKMGYYISFSGTVTYKNAAKVKEAATVVPMDRLLIETDCPYLAPEPVRGTRNDSSNVRYIAECIAQIKGCDAETIAKNSLKNAKRVYGIE